MDSVSSILNSSMCFYLRIVGTLGSTKIPGIGAAKKTVNTVKILHLEIQQL